MTSASTVSPPNAGGTDVPRGLFSLSEISTEAIHELVRRSCEMFTAPRIVAQSLHGKVVGVLFTKTSTRTRTAFMAGTARLGGTPVSYGPADLQTNTGESLPDTGRILGCMLDALVARTAGPVAELKELALAGSFPVINAMATEEHPTQGICDLAILNQVFGQVANLRVLYIGEGNNTAAALANGLAHFPDCVVTFATPGGYGLSDESLRAANARAETVGTRLVQTHDMNDLPDEVDAVYTSRWQTTGTSKSDPSWRERFASFRVDEKLMERWPDARVLHDLPAHRGEEITGAVLDGPSSDAWTQAQMKLTSAMAVLEWSCHSR